VREAYVRDVCRMLVDTNRLPLVRYALGVTMATRLFGLSGIALAALFPLSLSGQVICSAPHSSPTLAQGGSLSTLPVGGGWAQMPVHRLGVESLGVNSVSSGVGDLRFAARVSPELFGFEAPVGLRFGAKVPGSDVPPGAVPHPMLDPRPSAVPGAGAF